VREPHLVLITAASALGRSSLYNRLKIRGRPAYLEIGYTDGWGHFHLDGELYARMKAFLAAEEDPVLSTYRFGRGPSYKLRVVRRCLERLGLPDELLRHGIRRQLFAAPLAENAREFLRGEAPKPQYFGLGAGELFRYFRERWLLPRAARDQSFKELRPEDFRITRMLEVDGEAYTLAGI